MTDVRKDSIAAAVRDLAHETVTDSLRPSVFQDVQTATDMDIKPGTTIGGVRKKLSGTGTGTGGGGAAFTNIPETFQPNQISAGAGANQRFGTPAPPRAGSAVYRPTVGTDGSTMAVYLSWAPPLLDEGGRWLLNAQQSAISGISQSTDLIQTYLIVRETNGLGEVATVGAVSHSEQYISEIKAALELAGKVTTDSVTLMPTFDPSILDPEGKLLIDETIDKFFTFVDMTAQQGREYIYYISAITPAQEESDNLEIIPEAGSGGNANIQLSSTWVSSFPDLASPDGTAAFADFIMKIGTAVTDVEIGIVPIAANVIPIDTTIPPEFDPFVTGTEPPQITLAKPASGSTEHLVVFKAKNVELAGGISNLLFRTGVSLKAPVASNLSKKQIGSTDEWEYTARIVVTSAAEAGPLTMTLLCVNGATTTCSAIKIEGSAVVAGSGATFTTLRIRAQEMAPSVIIHGTNMDRIARIRLLMSNTGADCGLADIVQKATNLIAFDLVLPEVAVYKLQAEYESPYASTGKDTAILTINTKIIREPGAWSVR